MMFQIFFYITKRISSYKFKKNIGNVKKILEDENKSFINFQNVL